MSRMSAEIEREKRAINFKLFKDTYISCLKYLLYITSYITFIKCVFKNYTAKITIN